MFRSVALKFVSRNLVKAPQCAPVKAFSTSFVTFKKEKKSAAKEVAQEEVEDPSIILKSLEDKYKESLTQFKAKTAITRQGNSNPKIFDELKVSLNHNEVVDYLSIAQTSLKGRNLIITVFDPMYSKHVISAILNAGLNLNPEQVPNIPQQLKVSLPPITTESRLAILKELKKNFEFFKNSNSFKYSLSFNRAEALKELKQFKKNDQVKKVNQDVEKLHKKYTTDLQELLKSVEKQVMN